MPGTNGRSDLVGTPIQLGDFLPERRLVVLNGQQYTAWVTTNKRYPRSIMARLDKVARTYNRVILPLLEALPEDEQPGEDRLNAAIEQPEAWADYVTQAVLLLVPNLQESEIELVDLATLEGLLRDLGYFPPLPAPIVDTEPEQGEVEQPTHDPLPAPSSTGDSPPPDLRVFTGQVPASS